MVLLTGKFPSLTQYSLYFYQVVTNAQQVKNKIKENFKLLALKVVAVPYERFQILY